MTELFFKLKSASSELSNATISLTFMEDNCLTISDPIESHPNVFQADITYGYQGDFPDIGAYESASELWIPGIDFTPLTYPWEWALEGDSE